ncbi:hypothetical protein [Elioraea sp.]|uniref:hypothetical protein n=1 Tax=Elioraea sp. TaxID=2185103 RepID=UPI0025C54196|nr:hypothetical protein [Elioraea sp.]
MPRPKLAALALIAGAAALQACGTPQPTRDEGRANPPEAAASASGGAPFVPASATLAAVPRAAATSPRSPAPAPQFSEGRSPRSARDLAGLTDGQLLAVMGEPDLKRDEEGTQAWLYRSPACLLDVFLEAEELGGEPRVVLATARQTGAARIAEETCLRGLARARAGLRQPFQP